MDCTDEEAGKFQVNKRVQQITNCSCSSCVGTRSFVPLVREESSPAEHNRISDLLSRALPVELPPPKHDLGDDGHPTLSPRTGPSLTLGSVLSPTLDKLDTLDKQSVTPPSLTSPSSSTSPPEGVDLPPVRAVLMDNEVDVPLPLDRSSHYDFPGPYGLQGEIVEHLEVDDNSEGGLSSLMTSLNAFIKEDKYKKLSLSELSNALSKRNALNSRTLSTNTLYSASPLQEEDEV